MCPAHTYERQREREKEKREAQDGFPRPGIINGKLSKDDLNGCASYDRECTDCWCHDSRAGVSACGNPATFAALASFLFSPPLPPFQRKLVCFCFLGTNFDGFFVFCVAASCSLQTTAGVALLSFLGRRSPSLSPSLSSLSLIPFCPAFMSGKWWYCGSYCRPEPNREGFFEDIHPLEGHSSQTTKS